MAQPTLQQQQQHHHQQQQQQQQQHQSQQHQQQPNHVNHTEHGQSHTQSLNPQDLMWEGESTFNIYIYDYCVKRGYNKSAEQFQLEAGIAKDGKPPIDAVQGLLFEWWSVFWLLFRAKSHPGGMLEEAVIYQQFQLANQNRLAAQQAHLTGRPPPSYQARPAGVVNGLPMTPGPSRPNAIGPGGNPLPAGPGPQQPMVNGIHPGMQGPGPGQPPPGYPGVPQPNGMPHPGPGGPNQGGLQQSPSPAHQPQPAQGQGQPPPGMVPGLTMSQMQHAQYLRSMPMPGPPAPPLGGPPVRQMTGPGPGQGQGQGGAAVQYGSPMSMSAQPPGGPSSAPSPYAPQNRPGTGMGNPPNAPSPLNPNQQQQQHPQQQYVGGRPMSRAGGPETPRSASITHPSPSMSHRQTPQQQHMPNPLQGQGPGQGQGSAPPPIMDDSMLQQRTLLQEFDKMMAMHNPQAIQQLIQSAGLPPGKTPDNLDIPDKIKLENYMRGAPHLAHMAQMNAQALQAAQPQQPPPQPAINRKGAKGTMQPPPTMPPARGVKRGSSSPAADVEASAKDSPRQTKRSRPSPKSAKIESVPNPTPSAPPAAASTSVFPGGGGIGFGHPGTPTQTNPMPNGVQGRPLSTGRINGMPMNMQAHQPVPMSMQPTGPMGNLQPNTMVSQPGGVMTNPGGMPMQPQQIGSGHQYYRNPQQKQAAAAQAQAQAHAQAVHQQHQQHPTEGNQPFANQGTMAGQRSPQKPNMMQPPSARAPSAQGMKTEQQQQQQGQGSLQPPSQSQQGQGQDSIPTIAPAHPGAAPSTPTNNGAVKPESHSAPPTASTSPNISNNSNASTTLSTTATSGTGPTTPASVPGFSGANDTSPSGNNNDVVMVQRPATTPIADHAPSDFLFPGFGGNDMSLPGLPGLESMENSNFNFDPYEDFGMWLNDDG